MARVVSNLVDVGSNRLGQAEILLQVDRKVGGGLFSNLSECVSVFLTVNGDTHDASSTFTQRFSLSNRGINVLRFGRCHALNSNGFPAADGNVADWN